MKRHILVLPSWFSEDSSDGIFIREHARMLASCGHQVACLFVKRSAPGTGTYTRWWVDSNVQYGLSRSWYPPKLPLLSTRWKLLYRTLYEQYVREFGEPEILHAHSYVAGIVARYLSRHTGIPYILTEHSTSLPLSSVPWHHAISLRHVYQDASALIAVSDFMRRAMQKWTSRSDIRVIFNPVDCKKFTITDVQQQDCLRIISIGSLEPRKNVQAVLRIIKALQDDREMQLTIIGRGSEEIALRKLSMDIGISDAVHWIGDVRPETVAYELARSSLLVSASHTETFGMVIAEAIACGVPVVVTDSGAPREYLNETLGVIVPCNDSSAFLEAVNHVLSGNATYDKRKIRQFALDNFDFPVIGSEVDRVYDSVLNTTSQ